MANTEYFVIYAISSGIFRLVSDKETQCVQFYSSYDDAKCIKEQLEIKHPNVHYHIRSFQMEDKFSKEFEN